MVVTSQEYLSRITKPIPIHRFLLIDPEQQAVERLWYRYVGYENVVSYIHNFDGYTLKLILDEFNNVTAIHMALGPEGVDEIPDEVANASLKMLYPTISPITIGIVAGAGVLLAAKLLK